RWRPQVKRPDEFATAVIPAQLRSYMFRDEDKKIAVIEDGKAGTGIKRIVFKDVEDLTNLKGVRLAEKVLPLHIAIITASFPYEKQVEEFRRALRLATRWEAHREIEFLGFEIQRRKVGPDGKVKAWNPDDHQLNLRVIEGLMTLNGKRSEPDDPKLKSVIF